MMLIAILFCLALQRFINIGDWFKPVWFEAYLKSISPWLSKVDERLVILLIIAPILLLFALLHFVFLWSFNGLFDLSLAVIVLFLCLDTRDLKNKLAPYFSSLEKSDMPEALNAVSGFVEEGVTDNAGDLQRAVSKAILLKSFEQIFVGLFWFIVFGVYGLATYFLLTLLRQNALKVNSKYVDLVKHATLVQNMLEWLPARLLGFSFALVGNFGKGFRYCTKHLWSGLNEGRDFVVGSGFAALDVGDDEADQSENCAVLDVINRVLIVWLVGVAFIFIGLL